MILGWIFFDFLIDLGRILVVFLGYFSITLATIAAAKTKQQWHNSFSFFTLQARGFSGRVPKHIHSKQRTQNKKQQYSVLFFPVRLRGLPRQSTKSTATAPQRHHKAALPNIDPGLPDTEPTHRKASQVHRKRDPSRARWRCWPKASG